MILPQMFKNKPTQGNFVFIEATYEAEPEVLSLTTLDVLLFKQFGYKAKQEEKPDMSWLKKNKYKVMIYNSNTGRLSEKDLLADTRESRFFVEANDGKKIKLYLDEFKGEDVVDYNEVSSNGLSEKIVTDTLNYSGIILDTAMAIGVQKFQNPSRVVMGVDFDMDTKEVLVTTDYRGGKSKVRVESFPFELLWKNE